MVSVGLLIKLIFAHLLGDFVLQPKSWVEDKEARVWRSSKLYMHGFLHGVLVWIASWELAFWPYAFLIGITHLAIDGVKAKFSGRHPKTWFVTDQLLHLTVLIFIWIGYENVSLQFVYNIPDRFWLLLTGFLFITLPSSIIVKVLISSWAPKTNNAEGLDSAGKWIGIIERILALTFILVNQWGAIGFLLAAKSIFRFGDLKEAQDRHLTEYILIGTLLSFSLALFTGIAIKYFT